MTDLSDLSVIVDELEENVPYYFQVAAMNSAGYSDFRMAFPPYASPSPRTYLDG